MQRAVILRRRARTLPRAAIGVKGGKRYREASESGSVAAPVEMRLQKFGDGRRFDGCFRRSWRSQAARGADCEARMISNRQGGHQGKANPECPEVIGAPAHQPELTRNSRPPMI